MIKTGDIVFLKSSLGKVPCEVSSVAKNGRIRIGKWFYNETEIIIPTEDELEDIYLERRAEKVLKSLTFFTWDLTEKEVLLLEEILERKIDL